MGCIVKLGGKYLIWSDVVDAPTTFGMTREELTEHIREEHGRRGLEELPARIDRCDAKGTISFVKPSAVSVVWLNRAGAKETCLTIEQLIEHFVTNPTEKPPNGENDGPNGPVFPEHWRGRTP